MARIRTIRPEFFLHEDLAALSYQARLLFIGLWTQADREGRLEDRPKRLKAQLFPYDKVDIESELQSLHDYGFIVRYVADCGSRCIAIPKFAKHQHVHVHEGASTIPAPTKHPAGTVLASAQHPTKRLDSLMLDAGCLMPDAGCSSPALRPVGGFSDFWLAYPRKVGKGTAEKVWRQLRPPLPAVLAALSWQREDTEWLKEGGKFIPHPEKYLRSRRWEDEPQAIPTLTETTMHNLAAGEDWLRRTR